MQHTAQFIFHGSLKTLVADSVTYRFNGHPAVKDAIEAIGVPHTEVSSIMLNGSAIDLSHQLQPGLEVAVYPLETDSTAYATGNDLQFIADVHLGTLARRLRLLGFDVLFNSLNTEKEITEIAATEDRIVLSRSAGLLKHKSIRRGCLIRFEETGKQLDQVMNRYGLRQFIQSFTRCMACNGAIKPVSKAEVLDILPPLTRQYFNEFWQCTQCSRVYWKGSHYERMLNIISKIEDNEENRGEGNPVW